MLLKTGKTGLTFCLLLSLFSCAEDLTECLSYENEPITAVVGPSIAAVGETVTFEVDFSMRNGCGSFERLVENVTGFTRMIAVQAKYEGCICHQAITERTVIYEFIPEAAGEYELHFRIAGGNFITKEVVVE